MGSATVSLWLIWGSTYLAILWAIRTLPPFLMAGARFVVAGLVFFAWAKIRGAEWPRAIEWRSAAIVGALLVLVGNGAIVWAEMRLPTGLAALLVATVPLWMVVLDSLRPGGTRPSGRVLVGVATGLAGVGVLVSGNWAVGSQHIDPWGVVACLSAAMCWSIGSIYSRRAALPKSPRLAVGMELLCGGSFLVIAGCLHGEVGHLNLAQASAQSWLALAYLAVFGSLVGFSAYVFLLGETTPARATTYAYVNPVVAVLLGWALAGESITVRTLTAMAIIVTAVVLITSGGSRPKARQADESAADAESAKPRAFDAALREA